MSLSSHPQRPSEVPPHANGGEADSIHVTINEEAYRLRAGTTLADAIECIGIRPPFAAAVNLNFVPRGQHGSHPLKAGDRVELIAPITGG